MSHYIHARLSQEEERLLDTLKALTGHSVSDLIKEGLRLIARRKMRSFKTAIEVAGSSVGKFSSARILTQKI